MKARMTIAVVSFLLLWSASASAQSSAVTAGAGGVYPAGTSFSGVQINALQAGIGVEIASGGSALGQFCTVLFGVTALGVQQNISIVGKGTAGSRSAANVATFSGTCTVDMGDGTPPASGVPFTATITTDANGQGSIGLLIGITSLPNATVNSGSMTIQ